jgi:hypothetical protein
LRRPHRRGACSSPPSPAGSLDSSPRLARRMPNSRPRIRPPATAGRPRNSRWCPRSLRWCPRSLRWCPRSCRSSCSNKRRLVGLVCKRLPPSRPCAWASRAPDIASRTWGPSYKCRSRPSRVKAPPPETSRELPSGRAMAQAMNPSAPAQAR